MKIFGFGLAVLVAVGVSAGAAVGQADGGAAECAKYAAVPLPAEADKAVVPKTPPACASYKSYRGIGRPVNYAAARACAWQERMAQRAAVEQGQQEPTEYVIGGSLILADIYFNGAGVKRDVPLAMRLACEAGLATLALPEITKLNGSLPVHRPFEFCDYALTTFEMNFCSGYASEIVDDRRNRYYDSLRASMTVEQRAAFEKLLAAQRAYVEEHGSEVDQGGTIRSIRTLGSIEILNDLFRTDLVHFERKQWPKLSSEQIAASDGALRREYEKTLERLRPHSKEDIEGGAVSGAHVAEVEEKWESYRDAWVGFARVRYPEAVAAIRAEITLERTRLLKTID